MYDKGLYKMYGKGLYGKGLHKTRFKMYDKALYNLCFVQESQVMVRTGVLMPNNQRQHRTSHAPKDVLP